MTAENRVETQGISTFYNSKIEELEIACRERARNLRRLEAQRNEWNSKGGYRQSHHTFSTTPNILNL